MAKIRSLCRLLEQQQQGSSSGQAVHEHDHHLFTDQPPLPHDQIIQPEPEPEAEPLAVSVMVSDDHHEHNQKKVTDGLPNLRAIKILRLFGEDIPIYHFHIDDESAQTQAMINFHKRLGLGLNPNPIQEAHKGDDDDHHKRRRPTDNDNDVPESSRHGKKPKVVIEEEVPVPPGAAVQFDHQQVVVIEEEEEVGRAVVQFDDQQQQVVVEEVGEVMMRFSKRLTESDVVKQQNRLLITKGDSERLLAVLTEAERAKVLTANKGDYVRVVATTPTPTPTPNHDHQHQHQEFILHLTKWGGSNAIVLKHEWTKLIGANNLQKGIPFRHPHSAYAVNSDWPSILYINN